jgi:hypothetical protein
MFVVEEASKSKKTYRTSILQLNFSGYSLLQIGHLYPLVTLLPDLKIPIILYYNTLCYRRGKVHPRIAHGGPEWE